MAVKKGANLAAKRKAYDFCLSAAVCESSYPRRDAEHRGILTRTGLTGNWEASPTPQRGLTADNVGESPKCSRSKSRSAVFSALAAARWRIFVPHAIAASSIAPMYARTRLGVERCASLIGVTKAVSVGASSTLNGPVDIVSDAGA